MVIKSIGAVSCARVAGVLYAALGLVLGAIFSLVSLVGGFASDDSRSTAFGTVFGLGAIVLMPILYGILGFVMALIAAWLYNVAARFAGGIELDLE